ncbi:unnamed protein product [Moneuplotes crassus]|uniref:Uncharacterized protein n=1 Tax=Euplotes crassus TaxID=5936 RepID=A0AAD1U9Y3_EUPCR|nr:unnamed protein product [Moneuplotes crassus]
MHNRDYGSVGPSARPKSSLKAFNEKVLIDMSMVRKAQSNKFNFSFSKSKIEKQMEKELEKCGAFKHKMILVGKTKKIETSDKNENEKRLTKRNFYSNLYKRDVKSQSKAANRRMISTKNKDLVEVFANDDFVTPVSQNTFLNKFSKAPESVECLDFATGCVPNLPTRAIKSIWN